ncbi:tail fiber assembly protein [Escherichia coli]
MYFYSATENAFYPEDTKNDYIIAGTWPVDALKVDNAVFVEYSGTPPTGKRRIAGNNGLPVWNDIPELTPGELAVAAEFKKQTLIEQANIYMNSKQWPGKAVIGRLNRDELSQYNLWLDYLDELESVDISNELNICWPPKPSI